MIKKNPEFDKHNCNHKLTSYDKYKKECHKASPCIKHDIEVTANIIKRFAVWDNNGWNQESYCNTYL